MDDTGELLLWLDFETTGLDRTHDLIIEVAAVLTADRPSYLELDSFQSVVADYGGQPDLEFPWLRRLQLFENERAMDMHVANGLLVEILRGHGIGLQSAEMMIVDMVDRFATSDRKVTLAGSGVSHFDHGLIELRMPRLASRLNYWDFDTSVARRVLERTSPLLAAAVTARVADEDAKWQMSGEPPPWVPGHRAMPDVLQAMRWANHLAALELS